MLTACPERGRFWDGGGHYDSVSLLGVKLYAHTPSLSDGEFDAASLRICDHELAIGSPRRVNASAIDACKNDNCVAEGSSAHDRIREFNDRSGSGHRPAISGENRSLDFRIVLRVVRYDGIRTGPITYTLQEERSESKPAHVQGADRGQHLKADSRNLDEECHTFKLPEVRSEIRPAIRRFV